MGEWMEYKYYNNIKDNDMLRESFNDLTSKVFGFDFSNWYAKGHRGEKYIPHVLVDDNNKVISNVSVNIMKFEDKGQKKLYSTRYSHNTSRVPWERT